MKKTMVIEVSTFALNVDVTILDNQNLENSQSYKSRLFNSSLIAGLAAQESVERIVLFGSPHFAEGYKAHLEKELLANHSNTEIEILINNGGM